MTYNISRITTINRTTTTHPTGDRTEKTEQRKEIVTVYGTEDVLTYLTEQLKDNGIGFSRLKTCIKFSTSTEKYEDIERQLRQKFPKD
jgi:hypothetical protein